MTLSIRLAACSAIALALAPATFAQTQQAQPAVSLAPAVPQAVKSAKEFTGDYRAPRTADGKPDLHGYWTNASVSRMDRPQGYPLIISEEQAAQLEGRAQFNVRLKTEKDFVDPKRGAPEKGKALPGVGNYDVAYTDPGAAVANINGEKRSSYHHLSRKRPHPRDDGGRPQAARRHMPRGRLGLAIDNPEERGTSERCLIIGNAGPPLGQYLYNNNFQIVQTDEPPRC